MIKDKAQFDMQFLQSLGNLTQSVPTNMNINARQIIKFNNVNNNTESQNQQPQETTQSQAIHSLSPPQLTNTNSNTNNNNNNNTTTTIINNNTNNTNNNVSNSINVSIMPNSMLYTYFPCKHQKLVTFQMRQFCKECGVRIFHSYYQVVQFIRLLQSCRYQSSGQVLALKTTQMNYIVNTSPIRLYKNTYKMKKSLETMNLHEHQEYLKVRERTINFIIDLGERMRLNKQTQFLGIIFLDYIIVNDKISELCNMNAKENIQAFGGVCLMIAAKSIELDERIPFLSTLKKYLNLSQYSKEEIRKIEQKCVDILKFHFQKPTLYDLLEYYGSQGIVLSDDTQKSAQTNFTSSPFSFSSYQSESAKNPSGKKITNNRTIELEFQGPSQQGSSNTQCEQNNLNDNSSTQETSSKNSNSDDLNPQNSPPPSHSNQSNETSQIPTTIFKDAEITPFKFYDIVQKIEKDFSKIAFLAIKDSRFYEQDIEILGLSCICYLREKQNISQPYREEILMITEQEKGSIMQCCASFLSQFDHYFKPHSYLNATSCFSPLKDIRSNNNNNSTSSNNNNHKTLYLTDNFKSTSNLTSTRFLQENKKPYFDNIDLNSYRVREKSFEKLGISSYSSTRNGIGSTTTTSLQLNKQLSSGLSSQRSTNYFDYSKFESKFNLGSNNINVNNTSSLGISNSNNNNQNITNNNSNSVNINNLLNSNNNGINSNISGSSGTSGIISNLTSSSSINNTNSSSLTSTINNLQNKLLASQNAYSSTTSYKPMINPTNLNNNNNNIGNINNTNTSNILTSQPISSSTTTNQITSSTNITSSSSQYQKPYSLGFNQMMMPQKSSSSILHNNIQSSSSNTTTNSTTTNTITSNTTTNNNNNNNFKFSSNLPSFEDEAKWNSHFNKTINSINFRANTFSSHSFLKRNKF